MEFSLDVLLKALPLQAQKGNSSLSDGQLPEWPNGADCNSAGVAFGGSNPSLPTIHYEANSEFSCK